VVANAFASVEEHSEPAVVDDGEIDVAARELVDSPPLVVLRWAERRFGSRLVFATAFGAAGCVLVDLIGRYRLAIDVVTLDTGLLFDETYEVWHALEER
jgi:phosphoadenosine phosphosulfate reductase